MTEKDNRAKGPVGTARRLGKVLDSQDFDVVHTHGFDADLIGAIATMRRRVRHVSHLRITPVWGRGASRGGDAWDAACFTS